MWAIKPLILVNFGKLDFKDRYRALVKLLIDYIAVGQAVYYSPRSAIDKLVIR